MAEESTIEKAVRTYAQSRGWYVRKFTAPAQRGVPDRIFLSPHGEVLFVEFKAMGGATTPLQERELRLIRENNGRAYVIDSKEDGYAMVDGFMQLGGKLKKKQPKQNSE